MSASFAQNITFSDLDISVLPLVANTPASGSSVYGLYAQNSSNIVLLRTVIRTANASSGASGIISIEMH